MCRGGGRGEEELSSPSDPGSGCSGVPQGWTAHLPALLPPLRLNCPPHTHTRAHTRALILAWGWDRDLAQALLRKGVWRSRESVLILFLASALLQGRR